MKLAPIHYVRPRSEAELLDALARYGADAAVLSGGQSLMPELALRTRPIKVVVDINHLPDAGGIALCLAADDPLQTASLGVHADASAPRPGGWLHIGPLVRHGDLLKHHLVQRHAPGWAAAAAHIGNVAVRNRGTVCGSLAYADPGGELPLIAVASGARVCLRASSGLREVAAESFFAGAFCTVRRPDEYIDCVHVPVAGPDSFHFVDEIARRPTAPALASIALSVNPIIGQAPSVRIAVGGVSDRPRLLLATGERISHALRGMTARQRGDEGVGTALDVDAIRATLRAELTPLVEADDAAYRLHLAATLLTRGLAKLRASLDLPLAMPHPGPLT